MSNRMEIAGLNWSGERTLPAFQTPQHLTIYDIRGASPAVQLSASTAAGLINRPQPRVYLITSDEDRVLAQYAVRLHPERNITLQWRRRPGWNADPFSRCHPGHDYL